LEATAEAWPAVRVGMGHLHQAARILSNADAVPARLGKRRWKAHLKRVRQAAAEAEAAKDAKLAMALKHFGKVSGSYEPGLFHAYQVKDLPRTTNGTEQLFGSHRYHERQCSGRKVASPGLVVRGSVRLVAGLATRLKVVTGAALVPGDLGAWRQQRATLAKRGEARRQQRRFRREPEQYLRDLEEQYLKLRLLS
jgi:hypothetical protein